MARATRGARADFAQWRSHGRVRPPAERPILRLNAPPTALRGSNVLVEWRCRAAGSARLILQSPGAVPRILSTRLHGALVLERLAAGSHNLLLEAEPSPYLRRPAVGASVSTILEIVIPPPSIELTVPDRAELGGSIAIAWRVDNAEEVWLTIDGNPRLVPASGEESIRLAMCGDLRISVGALGEGGRAERAAIVEVVVPPLRIEAPDTVEADLWAPASFTYRISGGAEAGQLIPLDRHEPPHAIPAAGRVELPIVAGTERFRIVVSRESDGATASHVTTVRAVMPEAEIDQELEFSARRGIP